MDTIDLRSKNKLFTVEIIRFLKSFPKDYLDEILGRQLLRSGSSMAANYQAACRSRSKPEYS